MRRREVLKSAGAVATGAVAAGGSTEVERVDTIEIPDVELNPMTGEFIVRENNPTTVEIRYREKL